MTNEYPPASPAVTATTIPGNSHPGRFRPWIIAAIVLGGLLLAIAMAAVLLLLPLMLQGPPDASNSEPISVSAGTPTP